MATGRPSARRPGQRQHQSQPRLRRKVGRWIAGVAASVTATVAAAIVLGPIMNVLPWSNPTDPATTNSPSPKPTTRTTSPPRDRATPKPQAALKVLRVKVIAQTAGDRSWVTEKPLSASVIEQINQALPASAEAAVGPEAEHVVMQGIGGVEIEDSTVEVELQGNRSGSVKILGVTALNKCRKPLAGTLFMAPPAGEEGVVQLGFNLDKPEPVAQIPSKNAGGLEGDYFAEHKYTLTQGEDVTFRLTGITRDHYCEYRFRFNVLIDGKEETLIIDNHGEPFKVSGFVRGPRGEWIEPADNDAYGSVYGSLLYAPQSGLHWNLLRP